MVVNPEVIGVSVILPQTPGNSSKPPKAPSSNSKGFKILDSEENAMFPFTQPRSHRPGEERGSARAPRPLQRQGAEQVTSDLVHPLPSLLLQHLYSSLDQHFKFRSYFYRAASASGAGSPNGSKNKAASRKEQEGAGGGSGGAAVPQSRRQERSRSDAPRTPSSSSRRCRPGGFAPQRSPSHASRSSSAREAPPA